MFWSGYYSTVVDWEVALSLTRMSELSGLFTSEATWHYTWNLTPKRWIVLLFHKLITKLVTFLNLSVHFTFSSQVRIYIYRPISVTYGWQIPGASWPYLDSVTICWIITQFTCTEVSMHMSRIHMVMYVHCTLWLNFYPWFSIGKKFSKPLIICFQRPVTAYKRSNCTNVHSTDSWIQKSDHTNDKFHNCVMSKSPAIRKNALQSVCMFVELCTYCIFRREDVPVICNREEFERCKNQPMDNICLELATFKEIATALLQNVAKCSSLSLHDYSFFFNLQQKPTVCARTGKKCFKRQLGSIATLYTHILLLEKPQYLQ